MNTTNKLSFQDMILRLTEFWKDQGCLVWHPHNVQVGAGTMNPATVLRVLGPEPWNVVYLEPSIRPDDGRFGDNPNRMQQHYQLQVILKPDPGNPQELYLDSLESVGINLADHDVRFVEDNWQQPALGAWGLGWEVWLDGQEITQFTYFQQAGSVDLDPVSVEITYGLDRIALALQGANSVWDMDFGADISYGSLLLQSEIEYCRYYFNEADVGALKQAYDIYENEAFRCLEAQLVAPAHDFNLKCSYLFNVMDTRGAIGVTERAHYFGRMRKVARMIAESYLEQRQRLEYPFTEIAIWNANLEEGIDLGQTGVTNEQIGQLSLSPDDADRTFVIEIGTEELPVSDLASALGQLNSSMPDLLSQLRLTYDHIELRGTPRRLAVIVRNLAMRQTDLETEVKGPPAERAYDITGEPTQAAVGFARSKGVPLSDLKIVTEGQRRYVATIIREEGRPSSITLANALPDLFTSLKFAKSMRWNQSNVNFSRPIRWLLVMHGSEVIPVSFAGVNSGRLSRGLRIKDALPIEVDTAANYLGLMANNGIVIQTHERRGIIATAAANLAEEVDGAIRDDPDLLAEVADLVERPTVLRGRFEEKHLSLPVDVLVAVMKKHQRYIPIYSPDGDNLLPYFIAVRNGSSEHLDSVRDGNEHVIRARFADAEFFYNQDTEHRLADFLPELDTLTFQAKLGSMLDKVHRLEKLTPAIANLIGYNSSQVEDAARAAALSKADLASSLVVEMTSLQGIIGGQYARLSGESEGVASAIGEQYEAVSQTRPGLALALSDRLDSLLGLFAVGLAPKGSNDPFALRRAAIQIVENLISNEVNLDLNQAFDLAAPLLPVRVTTSTVGDVLGFVKSRLETHLQEQGLRTSVVRAVLSEQGHNPFSASEASVTLAKKVQTSSWPVILDAYARSARITRDQQPFELDESLFSLPEEKELYTAYQKALSRQDGTVPALYKALVTLEPAITSFFDNILVMDDDPDIRQNRLALLQAISNLTVGIADLSQLEGF
jgi:glycyl-tRNA synthetase